MGHYDECRESYCPSCGAAPGNIVARLCEFCDKPKKIEKTPWFEATNTPYHIGAYEIIMHDEDGTYLSYSYWNGEKWSWTCYSPESVYSQACFGNFLEKLYKWRGLYAT